MNPTIITGYHYRSDWDADFAQIWLDNTRKATQCPIVVITTGRAFPASSCDLTQIIGDNAGHVGDLIDGKKPGPLCGWSATVMAGALICYNMGTDMIFKEQDTIAVGPWIERMYQDLGTDGEIVFGGKMTSAPFMACQQSLFLIPHRSLLKIVSNYLNMQPDKDMLPEDKFVALKQTCNVKELSFGVDRMKPIPWDDEVFYFQQATEAELEEAKKRGFV